MKTITRTNKKICSILGLLLMTFIGFAQSPQTFTSSGTWVCPAGVTSIQVEAWGAGGGGGGNNSGSDGAGGGGGGAYSRSNITVIPGNSYIVTVGIGGAGGNGVVVSGILDNGKDGSDSWFNSVGTLLAKGGNGGISGTLASGVAGGNGGDAASGIGTIKYSGGRGGFGISSSTGRGGPGGSSAGTSANGTSGTNPWTTIIAATAPVGGGIGGDGGNNRNHGISGILFGAGGGGSGERIASGTPSIGGDGADGRVIITWSCSSSNALTAATTATGPICSASTSVVTLRSSSMVTGTYNVTYNLTGSNSATGNTTTMNFTAGSPGIGTFTTTELSNSGVTTVTVTNLALVSSCGNSISSNNIANITVNTAATALAGTAITTCAGSGAVNITTGSSATNHTGITWTSNGTGTFTNATSLTTCTYNPSAADIAAGSRIITLTATGNVPCANITSAKTITINAAPTAVAGTAITTCSSNGAVNITAGSSATNFSSVTWTSNGTGTFTNPNSLTTCTYTPSAADITAGMRTLTLTVVNTGCTNAISTKTITITAAATAVAGTAITTCAGSGAVSIAAGSSASNYSGILWTSNGTGTFTDATSLTTCTYNPSAADIVAGSRILTLTVTGDTPCSNVTSTKTITIAAIPTAVAGTTITTCSSAGAVNITAGASATNFSSISWSSDGTGTFTNPTSLTTCTYNPSAADRATGTVILTLTSVRVGCVNAISTKNLTINGIPTAVSGTAIVTCSTYGAVNITAASSVTNASGILWTSNGTGAFTNNNSLTNCTYNPSAADIAAGSRILTLTAIGNAPCANVTSTKTIIISSIIPTVTGTTNGSRTGIGTVLLGATSSIGTLNWYDTLTGGTFLGSGTSFTTPPISTTTTFYVEAVNGVCSSSPRTAVIATVNYPEIDVQGNANSILNGEISPSLSNWTDFGTTNATRTYTIRNLGSALLTIGSITISGANASEFAVTTDPSSVVAIGSSTTFVVTFAPTAIGIRTASITITNNDTDENPYTYEIQGAGIDQEIDIQGNSISIVNGDTTPTTADWTDFGSVAGTRTFTIRNTGNIELSIGAITISGTNPSDFTVTTLPAATVASGSSTTFVVTFSPSAINTRTATISIINNDSNENPYIFAIRGFGIIPEIDIQGNNTSIANNTLLAPNTANWTDFSSITSTRTFTIFNNGNMTLNIGAITFSGVNASEFSLTTAPNATVGAFSSTTFVVTFAPTVLGIRNAQINIVNNDADENPYRFLIRGTGVAQEIDVQGLGLSIVDGDLVPSVSDGTDFGVADINLGTVNRTFTISNTGSLPLTISNPTIIGVNASEFTITTNPSTLTIGAGSSTSFVVTFNPSGFFTRVARIFIVNNDSNENPYDFSIQGSGTVDNDADGVENNTDLDDDNDGVLDTIECGNCSGAPFVNGSFENPVIAPTSYSILNASSVPGWTNSAEPKVEIWSTGFNGVPAAAGNQFAELNANTAGTLYQTFCLNGAGGTIYWSIKHRGRSGVDRADVRFGSTLALAQTSTPIATMIDGNTAWGSYSGTYAIPVGQTNIVLAFVAVTSTGGLSYGNFIDDVQIIIDQNCKDSDGDSVPDIVDVDDDNDGIPSIEEAGFKIYSNNKSVMDRTSSATWVDANKNGLNDYIEALITAGTYSIPDTDGDGVPNYLDLDSDNDTAFDVDEAGLFNGDGDINGDGRGDGLDSDGDGLLDLYDNSTVYGSAYRPYAKDSDLNGIPDYLQLDSNDDGINDIKDGLYGSYDANNDGIIDGSGDLDQDGITDTFDTNNTVIGSPRDLNRKLFLDFDGRNDYAENTAILGGLPSATLMAWIDLNSTFSSAGVVVGQDKFQIRVSSSRILQAIVNGTTLSFATPLNRAQWYHVAASYGSGILSLYLNGKLVATQSISGNIAADATKLTLGRNPLSTTNYFKGKIDEVRAFNIALTDLQVQRMVYQEIDNNSGEVRGVIVPKNIESLPYTNLIRYYRMDAYKDDIVDDLTTPGIDIGTGMKLYNHKVIAVQQAPMPFTTLRSGTFGTAVNDTTKDIRGLDITDYDYSIVRVKHNITEPSNTTALGMFVDSGVTVLMNNDNKIQNDWYLKLDGKIDLQGKSQLVQSINSDLEVTSAGSIERDQQGQSSKFNYNYWSSPVGQISTTSNNNSYTVDSVMKDGTDPANIKNFTWTSGYNGAPTSPITLSNYWIFKFQNVSPIYANWAKIGPTGTLYAGQGYTLKGSDAATATQNYTFVGKPNSGSISSPIAANNSNLSGNPYPSALDANAFITANLGSTTGTLYFWEHFSTNASHNLAAYQGGYATRTLVGGTPPVSPAGISGLGSSSKIPGRYIPVGQGFFVNGSATGGTINFDNSQRLFIKENDAVNSNALFRNNGNTSPVVQNNRQDIIPENDEYTKIRLSYVSPDNNRRELLLGFMNEKATPAVDPGYDAIQLDTQASDMYFINNNTKLVIQGDTYFNDSSIFPLGVKTAIEGKAKFVLENTENFDENSSIYIYDNVTKLYHNILEKELEINIPAGTLADRFSLRFKGATLAVNNFDVKDAINVLFASNDNTININNSLLNETVQSVTLYNILGQSISKWNVKDENQTKIKIPVTNISTGTYIVKVQTTKGEISKKIIIK